MNTFNKLRKKPSDTLDQILIAVKNRLPDEKNSMKLSAYRNKIMIIEEILKSRLERGTQ